MIPFRSKLASALAALTVTVLPALGAAPAAAQSMSSAINTQVETDKAAAASQNRINEIRERTQDAASRYAQAMADTESLEKYNTQLAKQVTSQRTEMASIEKQLLDIETTNREVQPLMQQMVNTLEKFVALDVPFLQEERTNRVANLQNIMTRADVTISEKYRLILEAYQIELEYGRTLEAYEGRLGQGDAAKTVEFVRLGRISLMYQTLDGKETGYWDANAKQWVVDNDYAHAVSEARRVAKKDGAPDLLTVPVPAPQEVRS
jgi:seryl-tRNA synthetase